MTQSIDLSVKIKGADIKLNVTIDKNVVIGLDCFIGANTVIREDVQMGDRVVIGHNCVIEKGTVIDSDTTIQSNCNITGYAKVESNVFFGPGVITTNDKKMVKYHDEEYIQQGPVFEKGCRIGAGSVILPGIVIGHWAIVGAGSVVTKHVLPGETVYGNPAKAK